MMLAETIAQNPSWLAAGDKLITSLEDRNHLIIVALMFLGIILKRTETIPDRAIPAILLIVGIVSGGMMIFPAQEGLLRGVCYAGIACLLYETVFKYVVRWAERKFGDKDDEPPPPPTATTSDVMFPPPKTP